MSKIYFCFLALFLVGCAAKKGSGPSLEGLEYSDLPKWVYMPSEFCEKRGLICASAEGEDFEQAQLRALNSLGAIFETSIHSKLNLNSQSLSENEKEEVSEQIFEEVQREVKIILQGAQIFEKISKEKSFYALATLDKDKTAKLLRTQIQSLDDQIGHYYSKKRRSLILKMLKLFNKRQLLNERLIIVSGRGLATKMSFSKIEGVLYARGPAGKVKLSLESSFPSTLQKWLGEYLTSLGHPLVKKAQDFVLKGQGNIKEDYLKVRGFKKYTYILSLESFDNIGKKRGVLVAHASETGRSKRDVFLKVKKELMKQIENKIEKLHLDEE